MTFSQLTACLIFSISFSQFVEIKHATSDLRKIKKKKKSGTIADFFMQSEDAELIGTMCFDLSFTQASPYNYASFFTYFKSNLKNNQKKVLPFFQKKNTKEFSKKKK